jgi:di/tricarboxylate transporter
LFALFLLVLLSTFQIFAPSVVALVVCVSLVLSGALRLEEAYREIDWRLIVIVGALLPFQIILPRYGITQEIAQFIGGIVNQHEIFFAAAVLILFSSILTQLLDSTIAVVALSPVAISLAESQGISVQPLVMAVAVGASFGFLTPLGHRAHLLIVAPGGYKTIDFIRVGSFLTIITIAITAAFCAFGTG